MAALGPHLGSPSNPSVALEHAASSIRSAYGPSVRTAPTQNRWECYHRVSVETSAKLYCPEIGLFTVNHGLTAVLASGRRKDSYLSGWLPLEQPLSLAPLSDFAPETFQWADAARNLLLRTKEIPQASLSTIQALPAARWQRDVDNGTIEAFN
jgi:hypothetical protein